MKEVSSMEKESTILDDADRLLTVQEVAERLHTSQAFTSELIKLTILPAIWFGSRPRVPKSAFNHFLTEYIGRDLRAEARAATLAGNLKETGG